MGAAHDRSIEPNSFDQISSSSSSSSSIRGSTSDGSKGNEYNYGSCWDTGQIAIASFNTTSSPPDATAIPAAAAAAAAAVASAKAASTATPRCHRSVMAYDKCKTRLGNLNCIRLPFFSSSDRLENGAVMGRYVASYLFDRVTSSFI